MHKTKFERDYEKKLLEDLREEIVEYTHRLESLDIRYLQLIRGMGLDQKEVDDALGIEIEELKNLASTFGE